MNGKPVLIYLSATPLHIGGAENHLIALIQGAVQEYRVVVLSSATVLYQKRIELTGAIHHQWHAKNALDWKASRKLKRMIKELQPVLVHVHDSRAAFIARLALKPINIPILNTLHLPPYYFMDIHGLIGMIRRWLYKRIEKTLSHWATTGIIHVSEFAYHEALEKKISPPNKTHLIPNGIDLAPYQSLSHKNERNAFRQLHGIQDSGIVVISTARLSPQKNIPLMLTAVKKIIDAGEDIYLWLVGDGPERSKIEELCAKLQLNNIVRFWGFQENIPEILSASDIFITTTNFETRPLAIMEAQAAGIPSVVTQVGDNGFLVEDTEHGFVIPPGDEVACTAALRKLIQDDQLSSKLGKKAREKALQNYAIENMVSMNLSLYRQILDGARR